MIDSDQKKGAFESSQGRPHRVLAMIPGTAESSLEVFISFILDEPHCSLLIT